MHCIVLSIMVTPGNMWGQFALAWVSEDRIILGEKYDIRCIKRKIKHHLGKGPVAALRVLGFMGRPKQQHESVHCLVVDQVADVQPRPRFRFRSNKAQWAMWLINTGYIIVVNWGYCGFPRAENKTGYVSEAFSRTTVPASWVNGLVCFPFSFPGPSAEG